MIDSIALYGGPSRALYVGVGNTVFLLLAGLAAVSLAGAAKFDVHLQGGHARKVIVEFNARPTAGNLAAIQRLGGTLRRRLDVVNSASFTLPGAAVARVAALPSVKYLHADGDVHETADLLADTAAAAVGSPTANSYGYTGRGIGIAVIDSGISWHLDLTDAAGQSRVKYTESFDAAIPMNDSYG